MRSALLALVGLLALPACGPDNSLRRLDFGRTAIVTGDFDTVEQLFRELAQETQITADIDLWDGYISGPHFETEVDAGPDQLVNEVEDLLRVPRSQGIGQYRTAFFSDGMRGVNQRVYNGVGEDDHLVKDGTVIENVRSAVVNGVNAYFSDWTYDLIEAAFPDLVDWYGDDTEIDAAQRGLDGTVIGRIVDQDLADFMELPLGSEVEVIFNFGVWAVAESVSEDVRVLLEGDVQVDDPVTGEVRTLTDVPLVFSASIDGGRVVYTSFHNEAQITDEARDVLRFELTQLAL
jgi:hypothetical protein